MGQGLGEGGIGPGRLGEEVRESYIVAGIGINVNIPAGALPGLAPDDTSILAETGRETDQYWQVSRPVTNGGERESARTRNRQPVWQPWAGLCGWSLWRENGTAL